MTATELEQPAAVRTACPWCRNPDVLVWNGVLFPHGSTRDGWCPARGETPRSAARMAALHEEIRLKGHP
jgi:hypothetical protein